MSAHHGSSLSAGEAVARLEQGNARYVRDLLPSGRIGAERRRETAEHGQDPYAIVICCSDSRVVPELIFDAGIGDLFVIRIAGNVIDNHQLGSIEYASEHLGCRLILVLGHTGCGAVNAAIAGSTEGYIRYLTDEIRIAIGGETDDYRACVKNVRHSVRTIESSLLIRREEQEDHLRVCGAVYDIKTGGVTLLEDGEH